MKIYTIGFTRKSAEDFFESLRKSKVHRLLDIRLGNTSQLAGFTKRNDLIYFLKQLCGASYQHEPLFAPTEEMLDALKNERISWEEYERRYRELLVQREVPEKITRSYFAIPTALLCSEKTPEHCHRRVLVEFLQELWGKFDVEHL